MASERNYADRTFLLLASPASPFLLCSRYGIMLASIHAVQHCGERCSVIRDDVTRLPRMQFDLIGCVSLLQGEKVWMWSA